MASRTTASARGGSARRATGANPWSWRVDRRTLAVAFPAPYLVLSWAPLGGGLRIARRILNHQIELDDRRAVEAPVEYLSRLARRMGHRPEETVAMMTGAEVARAAFAAARRDRLAAAAWCTAGCSNALAVGDPATVERARPGTVNLIVALNCPLSVPALIEALQIAVEGRVVAIQSAGIASTRSRRPATGTGTDCVAIAAPFAAPAEAWCGKHTRIGQLIGAAAMRGCAGALARRAG